MKKRILCFVLTLIMLVSLVPVSALNAEAASNAISATAIYVLKQLEGYKKTCENGYIGYGTKCPKCLGKKDVNANVDCGHFMYEKEADKILREELKELDKAVNKFADKNGLTFSQNQHDALVMFSFENGTAWTLGTGAFQNAIKSGYTGSKFLEAICLWEIDSSDDYRRMVEANMYLNGVYSSSKPSRYIRVIMDTDGQYMPQNNSSMLHYFDVASPVTITLVPTHDDPDYSFLGWYVQNSDGTNQRVTTLTSSYHGKTLTAFYQNDKEKPGTTDNGILYTVKKANLMSTSVYNKPNGDKVTTYINEYGKEVTIKLADVLNVTKDYIDSNGIHWAYIVEVGEIDGVEFTNDIGWVKVKSTGSSNTNSGLAMDVTVTVTNTYVNMRKNASITSAKNGSFNMGQTLRIIDTKNGADGFLWGQVAAGANDESAIGWVALMYTDYDSVIASNNASAPEASIATATIQYTGYVNVRSEAGINNQIVGALSHGETVELYEVKYVNGIRWGRCATGWFCLTYARVTGLDSNTGTGEVGFTNYIYLGTLTDWTKNSVINDFEFYDAPNGNKVEKWEVDSKGDFVLDKNGDKIAVKMPSAQVKIANLRAVVDGTTNTTWAYTPYGWIVIAEHDNTADELAGSDVVVSGISIEWEKYYALTEDVTVRKAPRTTAQREDVMLKGTEFNVKFVVMVGESIWGFANKEGEADPYSYYGWVNLSNANVGRNGDYGYAGSTESTTGKTVKMAKVVGTDSLRVRITGASYGTVIGSLSNGTTAKVLDEKDGWYLLDIDVDNDPSTGSWCSGSYLELYDAVEGGSSSNNSGTTAGPVETGLGMVANTYTGVNVRTGAGTAYPVTGKIMTGNTVEILEVKTVGASKWGRTAKGWVCMDYIVMVDKYQTGLNGGNAGSNTTTSSNIVIYTGKTNQEVTIYKNTNTASDGAGGTIPVADPVRVVDAEYPVTVHELIVQVEYDEPTGEDEGNDGKNEYIIKRTSYWARVNEGYIYAPGDCIDLDTLDEHAYTVTVDKTKVYEDWDMSSVKSFTLAKGTKVYITQLHIYHDDVMCFFEHADANKQGWVKLANLDKGFASSTETEEEEENNNDSTATEPTGPSTVIGSTGNTGGSVSASGYKYTGKVINTNQVNVRATASTTANVTTTLKNGASLVIYETVISEYMAWGRCDSGWVYLYYVDLTPVGSGAVDAKVVYNDNTVIYKDMGMTEATGSTYAKMAVVDIYEIVGKMARTELGWIHMDNLL